MNHNNNLYVCTGRSCCQAGAEQLIEKACKKADEVVACKCLGDCDNPVNIHANGKTVSNVTDVNLFDKIQQVMTQSTPKFGQKEVDITDDFLNDI